MRSLLQRLAHILAGTGRSGRSLALNGFLDTLVQAFENSRPGLSEETIEGGRAAVARFFLGVYEKEKVRLKQAIRLQESMLEAETAEMLYREVDEIVRTVVVPAYVRLAAAFTPRERNGFYLTAESLHGLERVLWGIAGMALGFFVIWAPFIPLWSKEWVLPFVVAGLVFPNLRRFLAVRNYEAELNELVSRADREIGRIDVSYLVSSPRRAEPALEPPLADEDAAREARAERKKVEEGGG